MALACSLMMDHFQFYTISISVFCVEGCYHRTTSGNNRFVVIGEETVRLEWVN